MDWSLSFLSVISVVSLYLMVMACIEVGSNDAANLVNAVFGARIMPRKRAVYIAGIFVVLGAVCASPVMNTVRKGIFDISILDANSAISIFLASYLANTLLLFIYSGYGLPVSTTATLVFSLAGGALGISFQLSSVYWQVIGKVLLAIFISILLSGFLGFFLQRFLRAVIKHDAEDEIVVMKHGPWITGLLLTCLIWFMVVKGMEGLEFVKWIKHEIIHKLGIIGFLVSLAILTTSLTFILLKVIGRSASKYLFHTTSVIGMICMAFAFGQNDLANCASPGLAIQMIIHQGLNAASEASIPLWALFGCGFLMFIGMTTKRAQRVTRAEVNMASQQNKVNIYAPKWCIKLANWLLSIQSANIDNKHDTQMPYKHERDEAGKKIHYDALRASIILAISASVIALASSLGLPVSTTYVSFAAVISTGWGDRVFAHGRSDVKVGRAIWVVTSWLIAGLLSALGSALLALFIYRFALVGLGVSLAANFILRFIFKNSSDKHEIEYHLKSKNLESTSSNHEISEIGKNLLKDEI